MRPVTLDAELRSKLNGLDAPLEFFDEKQESVGIYVPTKIYQLWQSLVKDDPDLTPDEVYRCWTEPGGRPLSEIWKRLENECNTR